MTGAEPSVIHCDQFIAHPSAAVWRVLTDPELHARWWAAGDVRPVVGHRFTLDMGPWGQQACEVLAVEPERLLRYSFAPDSLDTTITWRLQAEGRAPGCSWNTPGSMSTRLWVKRRSTAWARGGRASCGTSNRCSPLGTGRSPHEPKRPGLRGHRQCGISDPPIVRS